MFSLLYLRVKILCFFLYFQIIKMDSNCKTAVSDRILSSGAERQQKALPVGAISRTDPGWLRHKPHLHLGWSAGSQRVPPTWPAWAPERHPETERQPETQQHAAAAGGGREEGEALKVKSLKQSVILFQLHVKRIWHLDPHNLLCMRSPNYKIMLARTRVESTRSLKPSSFIVTILYCIYIIFYPWVVSVRLLLSPWSWVWWTRWSFCFSKQHNQVILC